MRKLLILFVFLSALTGCPEPEGRITRHAVDVSKNSYPIPGAKVGEPFYIELLLEPHGIARLKPCEKNGLYTKLQETNNSFYPKIIIISGTPIKPGKTTLKLSGQTEPLGDMYILDSEVTINVLP